MTLSTPAKDFSWQDTNLPLFGSDEDKKVKKESALAEEAWRPVLNCNCPRLYVWRVEKFKVRPVNENDYGKSLGYDVHFWVGSKSTQDEYGTAAYKTVELDALLDDQAVQHREVELYESKLFKSYFSSFRILNGGIDSGFTRVTPNEYQPRLLHFHQEGRNKHCEIQEVELSINSLDPTDVFILDLGTKLYQWNGSKSNKEERYNAAQFLQKINSERNGRCKTAVLDELFTDVGDEFLQYLPDKPIYRSKKYYESTKCIYKLSDEQGHLSFDLVVKNQLPKRAVSEDDVYFIDSGNELFVYIGSACSPCEKQNALSYAHAYLKITRHPFIPVTVVGPNQSSEELDRAWDKDRTTSYYNN
ncbi:unnamed protein product [Heterobilharzia americana]|nr:unnamed protein product [Heterobilharzia americana]CAH8575870.1 unnamed protein product [Heterobilharzia americana]